MAGRTITLQIPLDEDLRERAAQTLGDAGLSLPDAVRLFLNRVVADRGLPMELKRPNAATLAAMREADELASRDSRFASPEDLFGALEKAGRA